MQAAACLSAQLGLCSRGPQAGQHSPQVSSWNLHGVCQLLVLNIATCASDSMRGDSECRSSFEPFVKRNWMEWHTAGRPNKDTLGRPLQLLCCMLLAQS